MTTTRQIDGIDVLIEGAGEQTIVMIHGWPDTYRLWDAQVEAFKGRFRCVRFTLPGFDVSQPRQAYSRAQLIETFKHIVEQTCPGQQVILMLHDWGCVFGYQFAMRHPALVSRIVGVDIGDTTSRNYARSLSFKQKAMIVAYQGWLALAWRIGGRLGDRMTRSLVRAVRCPVDAERVGSCMNYPYYIQWSGAHGSYRHPLRFEPACPMLFVYGTKKPFLFHSPGWADALAMRPGNQVLAFETGHWVTVERPEQFNQAALAWLAAGTAGEAQAA
jgi:pimeloyl-ACP methyl ester carboxylesterase